jgi:hypothetical protein
MAQAQIVNILQAKQSNASIQLYDAIHLYLMRVALIKKDQQKKKQHRFKSLIIYSKEDLSNQNRRVSSNFRR